MSNEKQTPCEAAWIEFRKSQGADRPPASLQFMDGFSAGFRAGEEGKAELLEALQLCFDELIERFDMQDPSTNPGIKNAAHVARAVIAKHPAK